MDVIEFVKTAIRMCENAGPDCSDCCFKGEAFCLDESYADVSLEDLKKAVKAVEEWAKEHPIKTKGTEFVKAFPHAQFGEDGYSAICPNAFDDTWECRKTDCKGCRTDFWNQGV